MDEDKKILKVLLDDDESFIVKKKKVAVDEGKRIDRIVEQIRGSTKEKKIREEAKEVKEGKTVQLKRLERIRSIVSARQDVDECQRPEPSAKKTKVELSYVSDVELKVLRAMTKYGIDLRRIMRATGYPDIVIRKAVEKLVEKGYLNNNLEITEKAKHLVIKEEKEKPKLRAIDIAIILATIAFLLSTLHYFGYI